MDLYSNPDYQSPPNHIPYDSQSAEDLTKPSYRYYAVHPASSFNSHNNHRTSTLPVKGASRIVLPVVTRYPQTVSGVSHMSRSKSIPSLTSISAHGWQSATITKPPRRGLYIKNGKQKQSKKISNSQKRYCKSPNMSQSDTSCDPLSDDSCHCVLSHNRPFIPVRQRAQFDSILNTDSESASPSNYPSTVASTTKFTSGDTSELGLDLYAEHTAVRQVSPINLT